MDEIPFNPVFGPNLNIPVDQSKTVPMKPKSNPRNKRRNPPRGQLFGQLLLCDD